MAANDLVLIPVEDRDGKYLLIRLSVFMWGYERGGRRYYRDECPWQEESCKYSNDFQHCVVTLSTESNLLLMLQHLNLELRSLMPSHIRLVTILDFLFCQEDLDLVTPR